MAGSAGFWNVCAHLQPVKLYEENMQGNSNPFDKMQQKRPTALSPAGRAKKQEILQLVRSASIRRRRLRKTVRCMAALAFFACCLICAIVNTGNNEKTEKESQSVAQRTDPQPDAIPYKHIQLAVVPAGKDLFDRSRAAASSLDLNKYIISDEELLNLMAESGRPAGLIRVCGRTILVDQSDEHDKRESQLSDN